MTEADGQTLAAAYLNAFSVAASPLAGSELQLDHLNQAIHAVFADHRNTLRHGEERRASAYANVGRPH